MHFWFPVLVTPHWQSGAYLIWISSQQGVANGPSGLLQTIAVATVYISGNRIKCYVVCKPRSPMLNRRMHKTNSGQSSIYRPTDNSLLFPCHVDSICTIRSGWRNRCSLFHYEMHFRLVRRQTVVVFSFAVSTFLHIFGEKCV